MKNKLFNISPFLWIIILIMTSCVGSVRDRSPSSSSAYDLPFLGLGSAPVIITEYSSFTCAHCKHTYDKLKDLQEEFSDTVQLHLKLIALDSTAQNAALVALAAGRQGRFWEASDLLFSNQRRLGLNFYNEVALNLNLNMELFIKDRASIDLRKSLRQNLSQARALGLKGTPMTFINNSKYEGDMSKDEWREAIKLEGRTLCSTVPHVAFC